MRTKTSWRVIGLSLLVAFTLSLHYMILPYPGWVHLIHRRICYIPILLGGLWFGLRGGLLVSGVISVATLPLALLYSGSVWGNRDLVEITFYLALGVLTGFLVDRRERERNKTLELRRRLEESERLASLGRMASGVAHEVRTPLSSIQGAAEILGEDFGNNHPRRGYYDMLIHEIERLKAVVREFLDLGRPISLEEAPIDPAAFLEECRNSLEEFVKSRGISVTWDGRSSSCRMLGDARRIHQAVTNMVRNAVQASPEGGKVTVVIEAKDAGCTVMVEDEGPGLPVEGSERIFEPFFTRKKDGTGLGLSLVKQIAEAHGGWVQGESLPGGGSRFTLWLPGSAGKGELRGNGAAGSHGRRG